jgi:hypothetical protein
MDDVIQDCVGKVASTGSRIDGFALWFSLFAEFSVGPSVV